MPSRYGVLTVGRLPLREDFVVTINNDQTLSLTGQESSPLKTLADITERLQAGDLCYIAIEEARFAAYLWVRTQGRHDLVVSGKLLDVRAKECWVYTVWVTEWARKRGLYTAMIAHALQDMALRGFSKAWNEVETNNRNAIRVLSRTGWKLNHRFRIIGLGPYVATIRFDERFRERAGKLLEA